MKANFSFVSVVLLVVAVLSLPADGQDEKTKPSFGKIILKKATGSKRTGDSVRKGAAVFGGSMRGYLFKYGAFMIDGSRGSGIFSFRRSPSETTTLYQREFVYHSAQTSPTFGPGSWYSTKLKPNYTLYIWFARTGQGTSNPRFRKLVYSNSNSDNLYDPVAESRSTVSPGISAKKKSKKKKLPF